MKKREFCEHGGLVGVCIRCLEKRIYRLERIVKLELGNPPVISEEVKDL